jgi:hypothetical protein
VQKLNRFRGFLSKGTRHKIESIGFRETQGVRCKTVTSSPSSQRTEGRDGPTALVAMGAGAPGGLGFVQGEELEEEVEGNSLEGLPAAETQRSGRQSWSTPAVGELQQVRRRRCPCRAAQQGAARAGAHAGAASLLWGAGQQSPRPSGSTWLDRIGFVFFEFIFNAKTILEKNLEIV